MSAFVRADAPALFGPNAARDGELQKELLEKLRAAARASFDRNTDDNCTIIRNMHGVMKGTEVGVSVGVHASTKDGLPRLEVRARLQQGSWLWYTAVSVHGPSGKISSMERKYAKLLAKAFAISPPRASTSRTIWPLASPPIAGLQDIRATASMDIVTSRVFIPPARRQSRFAARVARAHHYDLIYFHELKEIISN